MVGLPSTKGGAYGAEEGCGASRTPARSRPGPLLLTRCRRRRRRSPQGGERRPPVAVRAFRRQGRTGDGGPPTRLRGGHCVVRVRAGRRHGAARPAAPVSYTHLRAHETDSYLVCRLLLEK